MKIVLISNLYPPNQRGGAEKIAQQIAEQLAKKGHNLTVITTDKYSTSTKFEENIKIHRFKPRNIYYYTDDFRHKKFSRLIWKIIDVFNIFSYFYIKKILTIEKPDIILTHNLVGIGYLIPRLIAKLSIPHIHTLHDVQLFEPSGNNPHKNIFYSIYQKITAFLFKPISKIISPSEALAQMHINRNYWNENKIIILNNPASNLRKDYQQIPYKNPIKYLFIGQIENHKGIFDLVESFFRFNNRNIFLTIAGDGSKFEDLVKIVSGRSNIKILGKCSHNEVLSNIKRSHYIIVPSNEIENSPTVIYEAFSLGRPVIASNIGGIPELVNSKTGFLFEPGNIDSLSSSIHNSLLVDEIQFQELCKNSFNAMKNKGIENYIEEMDKIFKSVI